jgi:hypothetical protein
LYEFYTPSSDELALASEVTKGAGPKICFLILLKTFQRLGYFVFLQDVPKPIAEHISLLFGVHHGVSLPSHRNPVYGTSHAEVRNSGINR